VNVDEKVHPLPFSSTFSSINIIHSWHMTKYSSTSPNIWSRSLAHAHLPHSCL
jgi:hypothetical protein